MTAVGRHAPQRVTGEARAVEDEVTRLGAVYAATGDALERGCAAALEDEARAAAAASAAMTSLHEAVHARKLAELTYTHWRSVVVSECERAGKALAANRAAALAEAGTARERAEAGAAFMGRAMGA